MSLWSCQRHVIPNEVRNLYFGKWNHIWREEDFSLRSK
jgi:hypothetical protein